jgi:hypothetical protein
MPRVFGDIGKDGDGVQKMLAVVEDQKRFAGSEVGDQERAGRLFNCKCAARLTPPSGNKH